MFIRPQILNPPLNTLYNPPNNMQNMNLMNPIQDNYIINGAINNGNNYPPNQNNLLTNNINPYQNNILQPNFAPPLNYPNYPVMDNNINNLIPNNNMNPNNQIPYLDIPNQILSSNIPQSIPNLNLNNSYISSGIPNNNLNNNNILHLNNSGIQAGNLFDNMGSDEKKKKPNEDYKKSLLDQIESRRGISI